MMRTLVAGLSAAALLLSGCGVAEASTGSAAHPASSTMVAVAAQWVPAGDVATTAAHLLSKAKHSVRLEMYELGNPTLVHALIAARRRGVSVSVILDPTESQSQQSGRILAQSGISVRWMHVAHGIDHVKLLIIDGHEVLTGGVNWGRYSRWTTDADVLLPNDSEAAQVFQADWLTAGGRSTADPESPGGWTGSAIQSSLDRMIASAHHSIFVAANYLSDWNVQDALVAAHQRGVTVDVLLNKNTTEALSSERWLVSHGVTVRWATGPYLHAKVLLVDGREGMIGSANFSYHGMDINHEFDVTIPTSLMADADHWFAVLWATGRRL